MVSIIEYSVNKLELQWGWSRHIMLPYLWLDLIIRLYLFTENKDRTTQNMNKSLILCQHQQECGVL